MLNQFQQFKLHLTGIETSTQAATEYMKRVQIAPYWN